MLSYYFPPVGGGGVQRNLKYAKYLPENGWDVVVLSVKDILYYNFDPLLTSELPPSTKVVRTGSADVLRLGFLATRLRRRKREDGRRAAEPVVRDGSRLVKTYRTLRRFLAFPDAQAGWIPFAVRGGVHAVRDHGVDVILASLPPVSTAVVARRISRKTGVPFVLDFRDGWTDDPYLDRPTRAHARYHAALEAKTVPRAAAVVVAQKELQDLLGARYPSVAGNIQAIYNGFDPADFEGVEPARRAPGRFRLVYTGSLFSYYAMNWQALLEAIARLPPGLADRVEVAIVGQVDLPLRQWAEAHPVGHRVRFTGYVPHREAIAELLAADAAVLMLPEGDPLAYAGKVPEYLAAGIPIIGSVEPGGAAATLLAEAGHAAWLVAPRDVERMRDVLAGLIQDPAQRPDRGYAARFDRRLGAARLAAVLDGVVAGDQRANGAPLGHASNGRQGSSERGE